MKGCGNGCGSVADYRAAVPVVLVVLCAFCQCWLGVGLAGVAVAKANSLAVCPAGWRLVGEMCQDRQGRVVWAAKQANGNCIRGEKAANGLCAIYQRG